MSDPALFRTPQSQANDLLERRRVFQRNVSYFHFGECVVRTDPVAAKSLLMTKIESSQESSALQALLPVLRKCQASESQISLHKDDVRAP